MPASPYSDDMHEVSTGGVFPPMLASSPPAVIAQALNRDHSLLMVLTLQCGECKRHGAAKDGGFHLRPGGKVYCEKCSTSEGPLVGTGEP